MEELLLIVCPLCKSVIIVEDDEQETIQCTTCNNIIEEGFDETQQDN
jgi:transcription initiation factor TFIIIB Brf1 subunit/transcription initiation factor TFIIB